MMTLRAGGFDSDDIVRRYRDLAEAADLHSFDATIMTADEWDELDRLANASADVAVDDLNTFGDRDVDQRGPYDIAAAALEQLAVHIQLGRLNAPDRAALVARLDVTETPADSHENRDPSNELSRLRKRRVEDQALGKLRHPSLTRLWHGGQRKNSPA